LTEGVAHVVRDGDRRLRVSEADALLLQGAEELVVGPVCVGGAAASSAARPIVPAASAVRTAGLVNREVNIALDSF
jgi:hypothetical protein